jgi:sugar phosphate isomerase/epimerase
MNILLHTISLEPARWLPARVSQPLIDMLPSIAHAGFRQLEIYEPHLAASKDLEALKASVIANRLAPVILSSYLSLNPAQTTDAGFDVGIENAVGLVERFGFQKIRLFPGLGMRPDDSVGVTIFLERLRRLAARLPETEILLETHDNSLADDPALIVRIVEEAGLPKLGLLFQPLKFTDPAHAMRQFMLQKKHVRHVHLQNRDAEMAVVRIGAGLIPWREILTQLDAGVEASIEFVPAGMRSVETFRRDEAISEAAEDAEIVRSWRQGVR